MNSTPISNTLREHRKKMGLTQMQVAKQLGFTTAERISEWEKGLTFPSITNLFKLCLVYNTLPHELYNNLLSTLKIKESN